MKQLKKKNKLILIFSLLLILFLLIFYLLNYSERELTIYPLKTDKDLDKLIEQMSESFFVLLGEASHGTSEYYYYRKKISQKLITNYGFNFVLVEGDWDTLYKLNLYVKHLDYNDRSGKEIMRDFNRFPVWMWSNQEFLTFIEWLRDYNKELKLEDRVGVYGMDVYGLDNSMENVISYLGDEAKDLYTCLLNYQGDYQDYVKDLYYQRNNCQKEVLEVLDILENNYQDTKEFFNIKQNALVVKYGEKFYRHNLFSGDSAWNTRVNGMKDRLNNVQDFYGKNSKAIVWAHNTHVGDARATEMSQSGRINIGQLLREKHGNDNVYILGFSSYSGTVTAAQAWESPERVFMFPRAKPGSLEYHLAQKEFDDFYILLENNLPDYLTEKIGHRAKGVVYNPEHDNFNYVETIVKDRYSALIFLKYTSYLNSIR